MAGDWMVVTPPSTSFTPAEAPASGPVTSALTPLGVVPCCLVPLEVVVSGLPRAHCPVVAVSVPSGFVVQPVFVSKSSLNTVVPPPPWQEAGTAKPLVGVRPLGPPLTALEPRPNAANAAHMRQTSSPPWLSTAAWMMPLRMSVNAGLQIVFFSPSFTYSIMRWFPELPAALYRFALKPCWFTSAQ